MKPRLIYCLALGLCFTASIPRLMGDDTTAPDPDLPQPFDASAISSAVHSSPFSRVVSFADNFSLTGVAWVDGKPLATLVNNETKKRFVVTEEPNAEGWKLAGASLTTDPKYSSVKLLVGGEEVSLRYTAVTTPQSSNGRGWGTRDGKRRVVEPVDIHNLKPEDMIRKDKDGKDYVRGSVYLPTEDRDKYYNDMSREAHEKFQTAIQDSRNYMFKASPEDRQAYAKKVFDRVTAGDKK
jgi:hypothetical protein